MRKLLRYSLVPILMVAGLFAIMENCCEVFSMIGKVAMVAAAIILFWPRGKVKGYCYQSPFAFVPMKIVFLLLFFIGFLLPILVAYGNNENLADIIENGWHWPVLIMWLFMGTPALSLLWVMLVCETTSLNFFDDRFIFKNWRQTREISVAEINETFEKPFKLLPARVYFIASLFNWRLLGPALLYSGGGRQLQIILNSGDQLTIWPEGFPDYDKLLAEFTSRGIQFTSE